MPGALWASYPPIPMPQVRLEEDLPALAQDLDLPLRASTWPSPGNVDPADYFFASCTSTSFSPGTIRTERTTPTIRSAREPSGLWE